MPQVRILSPRLPSERIPKPFASTRCQNVIGFFVSRVRSSREMGAAPINPSDVARTQHGFDNSEPTQITVNGQVIRLSVPSDRAVVERVAALIDRRVAENDWRPHTSREAALQCWAKLGGIRVAVLKAKGLL